MKMPKRKSSESIGRTESAPVRQRDGDAMSMIFPQSVDATKDSDAYNATVRLLVVDVEALFGAASCSIAEASAAPESSQMMQDHPQHRIRRRTTRATLEQMNIGAKSWKDVPEAMQGWQRDLT
jgi:hypothetical protein